MEETSNIKCSNCDAVLRKSDKYCPECGQKNVETRRSIKMILSGFLFTYFSIDSRTFRTLRDLWIPGRIPINYLKGKRKSYSPPFSILIASIFISLLIIKVNEQNYFSQENISIREAQFNENPVLSLEKYYTFQILDSLRLEFNDTTGILTKFNLEYAERMGIPLIDSISPNIEHYDTSILPIDQFMIEVNSSEFSSLGFLPLEITTKNKSEFLNDSTSEFANILPVIEIYRTKPEKIIDDYNIDEWYLQYFLYRPNTYNMVTRGVIKSIADHMSWLIISFLPILTLLLKLLYVRREFYMLDHLLLSINFISVSLLSYSLILILPFHYFTIPLLILSLAVWLYFSLKYLYKQPFIKTFLKLLFILILLPVLAALLFTFFIFLFIIL